MRVYVDGTLVRAERTGELYFSRIAAKPYTVSVRFEPIDRTQSLIFNWVGLTSPSPRVVVRSEVVPTHAVNASIRLVDEGGAPYVLASNRRLLFALEDRDVEIASFNRSIWKADDDGVIHFSALSFRPISHLQGPVHVLELIEAKGLPNVPQWIFASGKSSGGGGEGTPQTVVMKPAEDQSLVSGRMQLPEGATTSSISLMLRPPKLGVTRVQESTPPPPPPTPLPTFAIAPPQSGLLTTIVAEAKLPNGGVGRSWQSNLDPSAALAPIDFVIPEELSLVSPPDQAANVERTDRFEWKPSPIPNTIYKLTASCVSANNKQLYVETFSTNTSVPVNEAASYDCDWRVQTIHAPMSLDTLATTEGWQARQFEEDKFDSGSTSISTTRHFGSKRQQPR